MTSEKLEQLNELERRLEQWQLHLRHLLDERAEAEKAKIFALKICRLGEKSYGNDGEFDLVKAAGNNPKEVYLSFLAAMIELRTKQVAQLQAEFDAS